MTATVEPSTNALVARAQEMEVVTAEDCASMAELKKGLMDLRDSIKDYHKPTKAAAKAAHEAACDREKKDLAPVLSAIELSQEKMNSYQQEQDRIREEARRAEQARLDEEARIETARLQAEAKAKREAEEAELRAKGQEEEAKRLAEAPPVEVPVVVAKVAEAPPPAPAIAQGTFTKKILKLNSFDLKQLCQAVAEGKAPMGCVSANEAKIKTAIADGYTEIPGVVFEWVNEVQTRR